MKIITPSVLQAATVTEAKTWCRVDESYTAEDGVIDLLIDSETQYVEGHLNKVLLASTVRVKITPRGDVGVQIPTPATAIVKLEAYTDGVKTDLVSSDYEIDDHSEPHLIRPKVDEWPECDYILLDLNAGYTVETLPKQAKLAILRRVADAYDNRGNHEAPAYTDVTVMLESIRIPTI